MQNFTQTELDKAFTAVCNPNDWRDKIVAVVDSADLDITVAAIEHFTATEVHKSNRGNPVDIYSIGYRMGPAGS